MTQLRIMKNANWDVAPYRNFVNRRFGGTYRIHLQIIRYPRAMNQCEQVAVNSYLEAIRSSETSVDTRSTRRHIPEDRIIHSHRSENLKS
jgi:hypothetical protein